MFIIIDIDAELCVECKYDAVWHWCSGHWLSDHLMNGHLMSCIQSYIEVLVSSQLSASLQTTVRMLLKCLSESSSAVFIKPAIFFYLVLQDCQIMSAMIVVTYIRIGRVVTSISCYSMPYFLLFASLNCYCKLTD